MTVTCPAKLDLLHGAFYGVLYEREKERVRQSGVVVEKGQG